jgi:hypothetical protein
MSTLKPQMAATPRAETGFRKDFSDLFWGEFKAPPRALRITENA